MEYKFPYDFWSPIKLPDDLNLKLYSPNQFKGNSIDPNIFITNSLHNPINHLRISESVNKDDKILIIVDDMSRPTPIYKIIPLILNELQIKEVKTENISILIALGTHRPMSKEECEAKLGKDVVNKFKIINHEWDNPKALHNYGESKDGNEIVLNKAMFEADFIIGIGSITPHPAAGFSGGGKIITPGVATDEAAGEFHWKSVQVPQKDVLGIRNNPMREIIDEIAIKAGLNFIVNIILDGDKNIVDCVSGHPIDAHIKGCDLSLKIWGVKIIEPNKADIIITDTFPMDQDLWQAVKALCMMDVIASDNAVIILVSGAEEGVAPSHPDVLKYGYMSLHNAKKLVREEKISKIIGHNLVQGGRLLERTHGFLVTPTISSEDAIKLGFKKGFSNPQDALNEAIRIKGEKANIIILTSGGEICPILEML